MSGYVTNNQEGMSGIVGPGANFQRFTTTGSTQTWTKPTGVTLIYMELIGGGGGGGGGSSDNKSQSGGGGGGAFQWGIYDAAYIPATLTVSVGAGAVAAAANN